MNSPSVKRLVEGIAWRAGYVIQARWRMRRLPLGQKLQRIFKLFEIKFVLDVGANEGQFYNFLRQEVNFTGEIHSFEPIPLLVDTLRRRQAMDPLWFIHPFALSSHEGDREINVMRETVFSSFLEPRYDAFPEYSSLNTIKAKERVRTETLDGIAGSLLGHIDLSRTFVKLDTQGFDLEVVKGGRSALAKIPALQTEVSVKPLYEKMPDLSQSIAAFGELGFAVSDLFLVSEDRHLRAAEFDCLMVQDQST